MNLNTEQWKEFYISNSKNHQGLFRIENCKCGCAGDLEDGDEINYIGAKKNDNGVMRRVKRVDDLISKGNGIMFICDGEGSVGYSNYMDKDFIGSTTTSIGYNENLNPINAMFIITVIDQSRYKYSYGRKFRAHLDEIIIKLPTNKEGKPDWDYMEQYIKSLNYKPLVTNNVFNNAFHKINTQKWDVYTFKKLISSISKAKAHTKEDVNECKSYYKNAIPYVSRTEPNNSVDFYAENDDLDGFEKGNAIVIGDTTATVSYQEKPFIAGDHIVVIRADWLNKYTGLFIVSILRKEQFRYSYGRAYTVDLIKNTQIKLPTKNKKPDWEFMENYIKSLPYGDRI